MSRFFAAACCVVVALQVLIGVPLAVCIGFLSCVELPAVPVQPGPPSFAPTAMDWTPPPPLPDVCTPEPIANLQPIVESRAQYGSPLVGSSLAAGSPGEELRQFATALKGVAGIEEAPLPSLALSPETNQCHVPAAPPAAGDRCAPGENEALISSLAASVEHLYALTQRLEADGEYGRADQVRRLARDVRDEIGVLRRHENPPPMPLDEPAPPASTVTEASFNPEPPPAPAPAKAPPPAPVELPPTPAPLLTPPQ